MSAGVLRLDAWWTARSGRERWLVGGLALGLAAYATVAFAAAPLLSTRQAANLEIIRLDAALARVAALPEGGTGAVRAPDMRPVPAVVTETAPAFGLAIRRIEPEGAGARVVVEDADFALVLDWIATLERDHGLRLAAVEMDRRPEPGTVSARLTLER